MSYIEKITLPPYDYFSNKNTYSGSLNGLNYKIFCKDTMKTVIWYGKNCCEKSEITAEHEGELSQETYLKTIEWLNDKYVEGKNGGL